METNLDWFFYEREAREKGFSAVCGIDEAGRGPPGGAGVRRRGHPSPGV